MTTQGIWAPGRFTLTNQMLSDLRAAGVYAGRSRSGRPKGVDWDRFAVETQAIRAEVACLTKHCWEPLPPDVMCIVNIDVLGHGRHDPDAGYLLHKAAVDGLCDAGIMSSDRRQIWTVVGRVMQRQDEEAMVRAMAWTEMSIVIPPGEPGFLLSVGSAELTREQVVRNVVRMNRTGHA